MKIFIFCYILGKVLHHLRKSYLQFIYFYPTSVTIIDQSFCIDNEIQDYEYKQHDEIPVEKSILVDDIIIFNFLSNLDIVHITFIIFVF